LQAVQGEQEGRPLGRAAELVDVDVGERLGLGHHALVVAARQLVEPVAVDHLHRDALALGLGPQPVQAVGARGDQHAADPPPPRAQRLGDRVAAVQQVHRASRAG
jgi:hypothetical protein